MSISNISAAEQTEMVDAVLATSFQAQQQTGPDRRQIHAKSHGLVWGEFIIEPNLPEALRVGLFKTPQTYPAWIRFSSGVRLKNEENFVRSRPRWTRFCYQSSECCW